VARTSRARHKIRVYFSKLDSTKEEEKRDEPDKDTQDKKKRLTRPSKGRREAYEYRLVAEGEKNVQINLARCCNPHPGDEIVGYITRGKGITVHRANCKNLGAIRDFKRRMISVEWEEKTKKVFDLEINARDRSGLLMDISTAIASSNANIVELHLKSGHDGYVRASCRIQVMDEAQLRIILHSLEGIQEVTSLEWK
jgi:GTP pyrophosphokinase